jgi:phospholipase/carboxylesterase
MHTLDYVEIATTDYPTFCMIWLHGLGADGHDFQDIIQELKLPPEMGVRFIFPHAPIQPVTINLGQSMRSWFDILGFDANSKQDEAGIRKSQKSIERLIDRVIEEGIASDKIILAGFSQGGALALHTALRLSQKIAGVIGLSTYLPLADLRHVEKHSANEKTPIFLAHGRQDFLLPFEFGKLTYEMLTTLGYFVTWHEYDLAHSVNEKEVADIRTWLQQIWKQD